MQHGPDNIKLFIQNLTGWLWVLIKGLNLNVLNSDLMALIFFFGHIS